MGFPSPKRTPGWGVKRLELLIPRFMVGLGCSVLEEVSGLIKTFELEKALYGLSLLITHLTSWQLCSEKHFITTSTPPSSTNLNNSLLHKMHKVNCLLLQAATKCSSGMKMDFVFQCRCLVTSRSWQGGKPERSKPSSRYYGYPFNISYKPPESAIPSSVPSLNSLRKGWD